jgi:hypothetical protein
MEFSAHYLASYLIYLLSCILIQICFLKFSGKVFLIITFAISILTLFEYADIRSRLIALIIYNIPTLVNSIIYIKYIKYNKKNHSNIN